MVLFRCLCVLLVVCVTVADDVGHTEDKPSEKGRSLRDYNAQEWKAMDHFPSEVWVPRQTESEEQVPRRRRIRKRKRRPPVIDDQLQEETTSLRKRIRPQRLDQIREPWEEITEDMTQRSYNRRRLTPIYDETEIKIEKIRDPFTALQEAEEKQKKKVEDTTTTSSTPDLKTLLKQNGGMSLSEVLQQKNLSLAELLKGNQQAISALVSRTEITTDATTTAKYRRFPPSIVMKKNVEEQNDEAKDGLTSHEIMEAQRKRLTLLHGYKDSKLFSDVTRYDVVTEETTERRIFVPANSRFYTSVDYKPNIILQEVTTTPLSTTTKEVPVLVKSRMRELPMTSAKLKKVIPQPGPEIKIPPKAIRIDVNEILGFSLLDRKTTDGPMKMSIDLGEITTESQPQEENTIQTKTVTPMEMVEEIKITTAASVGEKLKHVTAKEEIMEILNNPYEREQLSKILQMRNMTVEELVQQRERGSSQRHLADIFHNKTREPEPEGEPFIGRINEPDFTSFFNRKSKSWPMPPAPTPSTKTFEMTTPKPSYTITSFPTYKIETNKNVKHQSFLPVWKQLYPSFFPDFYDNNVHEAGLKMTTTSTTERIDYELETLENIENTLPEAVNSRLNLYNQNVYDDNSFINLPTGVKSAIFASLAIIGLSLVVFLTILVIFKWTQKQKHRLNYTGSFSGSKIKSPILEPNQKRSFKTFMTETLGKKRNYYKAHLQTMSDSFWDTESEKKSYMI